MDDLKDTNIIVGDSVRELVTLDTKLNEIDTNIANINVNLLNKQQILINIPILATRINSNLVQNVLLGTPTILGLTGYNVNDYLTVTNNIIKLKNTSYKIVNLSGSVLANYVDANGNPVTSGTRYYQVFFRRPSTVTVAGTNANDILNASFDIKTDNTSIADCEYTFSDTFSSGTSDPFNIDGFVFSISNSTLGGALGRTTVNTDLLNIADSITEKDINKKRNESGFAQKSNQEIIDILSQERARSAINRGTFCNARS